jgi:hypothetical protein
MVFRNCWLNLLLPFSPNKYLVLPAKKSTVASSWTTCVQMPTGSVEFTYACVYWKSMQFSQEHIEQQNISINVIALSTQKMLRFQDLIMYHQSTSLCIQIIHLLLWNLYKPCKPRHSHKIFNTTKGCNGALHGYYGEHLTAVSPASPTVIQPTGQHIKHSSTLLGKLHCSLVESLWPETI